MNIIPVSISHTNATTFRAKYNDYVPKRELSEAKKQINPNITKASTAVASAVAGAACMVGDTILDIKKVLGYFDISYCKAEDDVINIASGYNGGFYTVRTPESLTTPQAEEYVIRNLRANPKSLGGLLNYQNMVQDIKRQDLIQKGLKLHTYEINTKASDEEMERAAKYLKKYSKLPVEKDDLFFIGNEAIYYYKYNKTAYSVNMTYSIVSQIKASYRTCKFELNEKNHAIGYTTTDSSFYFKDTVEQKYMEQQKPQVDIPAVISVHSDNKDYAEAYRFGNSKPTARQKLALPRVFAHLEQRVGIPNINESELQFIKLKNKNNEDIFRIGYYDSSIGTSFIYDERGQFIGQMEYNKDAKGNIYACSSF